MTPERIAAIQARVDAITPGQWRVTEREPNVVYANFYAIEVSEADDARFIAAAPDDIAALLAEVARLKAEIEVWRKQAPTMGEGE